MSCVEHGWQADGPCLDCQHRANLAREHKRHIAASTFNILSHLHTERALGKKEAVPGALPRKAKVNWKEVAAEAWQAAEAFADEMAERERKR